MSKIKLLLDVVSDTRSLADSLEAVTNEMCDTHQVSEVSEPRVPDHEPTEEVNDELKLTLVDVRSVLAEISANGHGAKFMNFLGNKGFT